MTVFNYLFIVSLKILHSSDDRVNIADFGIKSMKPRTVIGQDIVCSY